jgi:DNA-binding NarL/FixJ family response regulator
MMTKTENPLKLRALIADDDRYFSMAISAILRSKLGFSEVIETASFDEAVERLETAGDITLAIFDLSMPGLESPAALRSIRDSFPVDKLAVVSASRRRMDIIMSLDAGAHGFVSKALGPNELQVALEQILGGTIYVPPNLAEMEHRARETEYVGPSRRADPQQAPLTTRQHEVLQLLVAGKSNKEIARDLSLGQGTVKVHLAALFGRLGVTNRAAAAVAGVRRSDELSVSLEN